MPRRRRSCGTPSHKRHFFWLRSTPLKAAFGIILIGAPKSAIDTRVPGMLPFSAAPSSGSHPKSSTRLAPARRTRSDGCRNTGGNDRLASDRRPGRLIAASGTISARRPLRRPCGGTLRSHSPPQPVIVTPRQCPAWPLHLDTALAKRCSVFLSRPPLEPPTIPLCEFSGRLHAECEYTLTETGART